VLKVAGKHENVTKNEKNTLTFHKNVTVGGRGVGFISLQNTQNTIERPHLQFKMHFPWEYSSCLLVAFLLMFFDVFRRDISLTFQD
jgi:hypothetical protein